MQEEKNVCAVCNNVAKQRCSGCQAEYYCSQEHQKAHWKAHSKACRPYKLVEDSRLGRHYVATRDIKVGEPVIHDKSPLLSAPGFYKAVKKANGENAMTILAVPVCLGCYDELTAGNAKSCKACGWPLCRACKTHGDECEFTVKHRATRMTFSEMEYGQPHPAYETIWVIRALALRDKDPKAYRKLMNLEDHSPSIAKEPDLSWSIARTAQCAKKLFRIEDVEEAEIRKIIRIAIVNAHSRFTYSAIYDRASYIEHNCLPNCSKSFSDNSILFWAAVPISKGDHITTSYVKPRWGTKKRRMCLSISKFFDCTCERCKDPTEFGTMFNAIKCPEDKCNGYALPPTFLVTEGHYADFVCGQCNKKVPRKFSEAIERDVEYHRSILETSSDQECRNFIQKWRKSLHENNSYIFDVEIEMALNFAYSINDLLYQSLENLAEIVDLCAKLTDRLQFLCPAEHPLRATLLYLKVQASINANRKKSLSQNEKLAYAMKNVKDLNEVERLVRRESPCQKFEYSVLTNTRLILAHYRHNMQF